jgi:hypothetical protein
MRFTKERSDVEPSRTCDAHVVPGYVLALRRYELVEVRSHDRHGSTLQLTRRGRELLQRLHLDGGRLQ